MNDAIPASIVLAADLDAIMAKFAELKIEVMDSAAEEEEAEEGIRLDGTEIIE